MPNLLSTIVLGLLCGTTPARQEPSPATAAAPIVSSAPSTPSTDTTTRAARRKFKSGRFWNVPRLPIPPAAARTEEVGR